MSLADLEMECMSTDIRRATPQQTTGAIAFGLSLAQGAPTYVMSIHHPGGDGLVAFLDDEQMDALAGLMATRIGEVNARQRPFVGEQR